MRLGRVRTGWRLRHLFMPLLVAGLLAPASALAQKPSAQLDQELAKTLVRLEEGQKAAQQQLASLKDSVESRFGDFKDSTGKILDATNKSIDRLATLEMTLIGLSASLLVSLLGTAFAVWRQLMSIERQLYSVRDRLNDLYHRLGEPYPPQPSS